MTTSTVASPNCGDSALHLRAAGLYSISGPVRTPLPEPSRPSEPVPIWLAVLHATACKAKRNGENHTVRWEWVSGRALYTNAGRDAERIEPLGVKSDGRPYRGGLLDAGRNRLHRGSLQANRIVCLISNGMSTSKGAIMTKAGSQQEPARKALRQPRNANIVCAKGDDVCELFLAELEARRVRLQKLLKMVWTRSGAPPGRAHRKPLPRQL